MVKTLPINREQIVETLSGYKWMADVGKFGYDQYLPIALLIELLALYESKGMPATTGSSNSLMIFIVIR